MRFNEFLSQFDIYDKFKKMYMGYVNDFLYSIEMTSFL